MQKYKKAAGTMLEEKDEPTLVKFAREVGHRLPPGGSKKRQF